MLHRMSFFVALFWFIGGLFLPVFVQAQTAADTVTYTLANTVLANQLFEEMNALIDQQKWEEAKEKGAKAQLIYGKLLGEESGKVADVLHFLGNIAYFQESYEETMKFWERSAEIRIKVFGVMHLKSASSFHNLGVIYMEIKKYEKAIEYLQKAADIRTKKLGENHLDVAQSYYNLGVIYEEIGEYDKSIESLQKTLVICLKELGSDHLRISSIYNNLGNAYREKGGYEKATEYYQKSLNICLKKLDPEHLRVADSYNNLGNAHWAKGEYDKSIEYYEKTLAIRIKKLVFQHPEVANSYSNLGAVYYNKGEYDKSIEFNLKALAIRLEKLGTKHLDVASSYNNLGAAYQSKGQNDIAIEYYQKALEIRLQLLGEESLDVASSYHNLSNAYEDKGEYEKSIEYNQKALAIRIKKLGIESPDVASSFNSLGGLYEEKGEYDKAIDYKEKALNIRLKLFDDDHPDIGTSFNDIGISYDSKGQYAKAIEYKKKALNIHLKSFKADHPEVAASYMNIGVALSNKGEYDNAIEYYQRALSIQLKTLNSDHPNIAASCGNIGNIYEDKFEHEKAIQYQKMALDILLKIYDSNHPRIASAYHNIGNSYNSKEDYDKAIEYYQKSLQIRLKALGSEHPDVADSYNNLGISYEAIGEYDKSFGYKQKALEIRLSILDTNHIYIAQSYNNMGVILELKQEHDKALKFYDKALEICQKQPQYLGNSNSTPELLRTLGFLSNIFEKEYDKNLIIIDLFRGLRYATDGLLALDRHSSTITSERSKTHWQSIYHSIYEQAIDISLLTAAVNQNDTLRHQTFTYAEKSKATQLQAQLKNADALAFSGIPDSLTQKEYQLRIDISWREKQRQALLDKGKTETDSTVLRLGSIVFDLRQQYDSLKTRFEKNYPAYYRLKYDLSTVSLQYVQDSLLQPDQSLLEYFVGDSSIYIFLVQPKNYEVIEIKKDTAFEQWIEDLTRNGIYGFYGKKGISKGKSINNFGTSAHLLYQTLIAPVKAKLGEKVIIIPDGILGYVPFEALLTEKPPRPDAMSAYKYLIQDHQISYCYSATLLKEMRNKKHHQEPTQKLLAMAPFFLGNADTWLFKVDSAELLADVALRDTLTALPNSGTEVASVSKILKGQAFYGKEANLQKFQDLASRYRILHLSTHGKADDRLGDYAYLAFGMPNAQGTFDKLYARDLYNLALNADLVVLSACETGIGKLQRGEGIVSLARAFAYAGAKSIVTTLWKVSDEQSKNLMTSFYKYLSKGKEKDEALRLAKLDFLKANEKRTELLHPFFWASFIGIGDMRKLK